MAKRTAWRRGYLFGLRHAVVILRRAQGVIATLREAENDIVAAHDESREDGPRCDDVPGMRATRRYRNPHKGCGLTCRI